MASTSSVRVREREALLRAISPDRVAGYSRVAERLGVDVLALYLWDRDLAAAAVADIAILEIAMRNAMSRHLSTRADRADWYAAEIGLDDRSRLTITKAWNQVPTATRTPGRVIAQLMFGFWRDLLEAGGHVGAGPLRRATDYESLWRSHLHRAFPGGRAVAAAESAQFTRVWTLGIVREVHALRNRVAHHEPLVNGLPIPGENRRISASQCWDSCARLAALLDRDLHGWFVSNSRLATTLDTPVWGSEVPTQADPA